MNKEKFNMTRDELIARMNTLEDENAKLHDALMDLDTRIVPSVRKYDEWGYCRIHRDIIHEFDAIVKQALATQENEDESA